MLAADPENTLVLMACSEAKIETAERVPLLELYNGPLWKDLLCGAGGSSTGCARALDALGLEMELADAAPKKVHAPVEKRVAA